MNGVLILSSSKSLKHSTFGSILIALYVFLSFFGIMALHGLRAQSCCELYNEFQNYADDQEVKKALPRFSWGFETIDLVSGVFLGCVGGIPLAIITFIVVKSGREGIGIINRITTKYISLTKARMVREEDYRDWLTGVIVFLIYVFSFALIALFRNTFFLRSTTDLALVLAFAGISSLTTFLYVFQVREYNRRRDFLSDKDLQLKQFELEYAGLRQFLHLATWVFFIMVTGTFFLTFYEYWLAVPEVMSYTNAFRLSMVPIFAWAVLMILGYLLGVLTQLGSFMSDIVYSIREYKKHLIRARRPQKAHKS